MTSDNVSALLRIIAGLAADQGKTEAGAALRLIAMSVDSGARVDQHLDELADRLEEGGDLSDWSDIRNRIDNEVSAFLSDDESGPDG